MSRPRDSQFSKVWAALDAWTKENVSLQRELSLVECRAFIEVCAETLDSTKVYSVPPRVWEITFKDGRGRRHAGLGDSETEWVFPKHERTRWRLLMFLAWMLLWDEDMAWHGQGFCTIYHHLVTKFLGRAAGERLVVAFKDHKVRYKQPRKPREITPEQRVELSQRLARARLRKELKRELNDGTEWNLGDRLEKMLDA